MENITDFKVYLKESDLRKSTVQAHLDKLRQLEKHCPSLSDEDIAGYLGRLKTEGRKGSYLNHIIFTVRTYRKFMNLPLPAFAFYKDDYSIKSTFSDREIERILNLKCNSKGRTSNRHWNKWTLFFMIMAYTGMRPGEVANLTIDSCDFGRQVFVLDQTKTVPRLVPMPPAVQRCLIRGLKSTQEGYLFHSRRGEGVVNDVDWGYNFRVRLERLGIVRKNISVYSLRHSFITRMLAEDVNIFKVQKIVGHKRIDTTAVYTHMTTKDIIKTIKLDPLTRKSNKANEIAHQILEAVKQFRVEEDRRFKFTVTESTNEISFNLKWTG